MFPEGEAFDEGSLVAGDADKNQAVTLRDAYLTLKASLGVITFNDSAKKATDMNHNSQVDLEDVRLILRKALKISES